VVGQPDTTGPGTRTHIAQWSDVSNEVRLPVLVVLAEFCSGVRRVLGGRLDTSRSSGSFRVFHGFSEFSEGLPKALP